MLIGPYRSLIILMFLTVSLATSCSEKSTSPPAGSFAEVFPNEVGHSWTYATFDSIAMTPDTTRVTVVGRITFDDGSPGTAWEFASRSEVDTQYVSTFRDTVRFTPGPAYPRTGSKYVFPLRVGVGWSGDFFSDTIWVAESGPMTVPGGIFQNAFRIEERWGFFNDYGQVRTWFVPDVGIVFQETNLFGFSFKHETMNLIDYDLASD